MVLNPDVIKKSHKNTLQLVRPERPEILCGIYVFEVHVIMASVTLMSNAFPRPAFVKKAHTL